ncbi:acyl-homoserine lactone acylase PvdQ precursor [Salinisphaera dokdonensis CL-ES53]|uniref:Acyl-homoserine lactone acylase PvdQ n=1 Tax=Salinisphaera dokdonensis CL-ES53 TaxID=1304272 RepID=A0ABV2AYM0_9GAMM
MLVAGISLCLSAGLMGCSSDGDSDSGNGGGNNGLPALSDSQINAPDGQLSARIQTTTGGVPHITADNLESAAFGSGYVQARDNVCLIADSIIRARGERALFYGPGPDVAAALPVGINVVTDFSYKALGLLEKANEEFTELSAPSQAMLRGFAEGYNKYVDETAPSDLPAKCNQAPWVRSISAEDLYAYYQLVALYASGDNFVQGPLFAAVPPNTSPAPMPAMPAASADAASAEARLMASNVAGLTPEALGLKTDYNDRGMGSNGWGIGSEMTENGKGALLANPHFPYTGNRRLYQMQITVPGVYDVNGAGLIGIVIPLIGFNDNVAWTHTVSTAQHFTLYDLTLKSGDPLTYIKDGEEKPITQKTISVEVNVGGGNTATFERDFYYSEHGPMLAGNVINSNLPSWGGNFVGRPTAFTYRDANTDTARIVVDQWLNMGRARNVDQFQQPFESCGSVLWVNTMYADDSGQAFYIDGTSVPSLSGGALQAFQARANTNPVVGGLFNAGVTLLDGSRGLNDWVEGDCEGRIAYDGMPKLERRDYVQNSNDSYWATNPDEFLTGFSPLYGSTESILSPRTRMGLAMLENPTDTGLSTVAPAGSDGKFTGEEIIKALYSNRAYYAETLLDELLARCDTADTTPIATDDSSSRSVAEGCTALANWDGVYDVDSRGAHVFRVFIGDYDPAFPSEFSMAFDPANPETTPGTPNEAPADISQDPMLASLARGLDKLDQVNIAYDARLGDVQRQQQSTGTPPSGMPGKSGSPIEWHGNQNLEGGFNIVRPDTGRVEDGTRYPRSAPAGTLANTGSLSSTANEGWLIAYGTSWHFGLSFTDEGPQGYGLISYGQSDDPSSAFFQDQDLRYSAKDYRKLLYTQADITADAELQTETIETSVETEAGAE